jgi:L-lactate dehydrogenase (cytochrome)
MAGGQQGVQRAVDILSEQIVRTMALLGVAKVSELDRSCLSRRP